MALPITLKMLLDGCANDACDDGMRIDTELAPLGGPGGPVKPAVYEGGKYQEDQRWANPGDDEPTPVIVIDNVPSQANRLEDALRRSRESLSIPEFVLDLSNLVLPAHLPKQISSLQFPHRNGDAYLRDATMKTKDDEGSDFVKSELGKSIFAATAQTCGPLIAWFPQALLYGFWQSHLGKKRHNTKHARAWVSEIIGWRPASTETRTLGLKGDPLNLNIGEDETVTFDPNDRTEWKVGKKPPKAARTKLSKIGHGQVLFMKDDASAKAEEKASASAVSFARITQRATVSFAQLRRVSLGPDSADQDAAVRALLVALGLHAHQLAFARGFALRSGAELRPQTTHATWLGADCDKPCDLGDVQATKTLLCAARSHAKKVGVPLEGWCQKPTELKPRYNLRQVIAATWPGQAIAATRPDSSD